jgi:hypothetical protein
MAETPIGGTVLSWNLTNWITVTLMALIAFGGVGLLQKWYSNRAA